jgi:sugar phosphate isomerase/epimerase
VRIGLSSYAYRWSIGAKGFKPKKPLSIPQFMEMAVSDGAEGVQICDHMNLENPSKELIGEIRRIAEKHQLFVETGISQTAPDYVRSMLDISAQFGARVMRMIPQVDRRLPSDDVRDQIEAAASDIIACLPYANERNIVMALENHAQLTSAELLNLLKLINDPHVGACIDTMNSIVMLEKPMETVQLLAPYALSVHLKDFIIESNPRAHKVKGVCLGEGLVDFPKILEFLGQFQFSGNLCVELFIDRVDSEEETLECETHCVRRSITYLKSICSVH